MSKTSAAAKNRYSEKAYDRIVIVVKKGEKERLRSAAEAAGMSVSRYVVEAVNGYSESPILSLLKDGKSQRETL